MTATPSRPGRLMTSPEVAELLAVEQRTLERWRKAGTGPPFMMFGRTIRYHPGRVHAWMLAREQGTPSPAGGATPAPGRGTPARAGAPRGR